MPRNLSQLVMAAILGSFTLSHIRRSREPFDSVLKQLSVLIDLAVKEQTAS